MRIIVIVNDTNCPKIYDSKNGKKHIKLMKNKVNEYLADAQSNFKDV